MSKTKEELEALKEEVNNVNEKLQELTEEDLEQVNGGATSWRDFDPPIGEIRSYNDPPRFIKIGHLKSKENTICQTITKK